MCGVSLTKVVIEDFGKRVVISLIFFRMALIVRFEFGVVLTVWHTII